MAFSDRSIQFNGVDQRVVVGVVPELNFERTDAFSAVIWFRTTDGQGSLLGNIGPAPGFRGWEMHLNDGGALKMALDNTFPGNHILVRSTLDRFNDGFWHQAVATYDGSSTAAGVNLYIDGVLLDMTTESDTLSATIVSANAFGMATRDNVLIPYGGNLDDVAVYNKALSLAEVRTIYNDKVPADLTVVGPTANLVGYWKMGDGDTFPTITDHSPSGNDGTMTNQSAGDIVEDPAQQMRSAFSVEFDGSNDFADVGVVSALQFDRTDPFTISLWFKTSALGTLVMIGNLDTAGTFTGWELALNVDEQLLFNFLNAGGGVDAINIRTNDTYDDGEWHQFVVTHDGSGTAAGIVLYVDGEVPARTVLSDTLVSTTVSTAQVRIGDRTPATLPWNGNLDNIAIYDKELSASEVFEIFGPPGPVDHTATGPYENLIAYWRMGDGDTFPVINDSSIMGTVRNDGTMVNMEVSDFSTNVFEVLGFISVFDPALGPAIGRFGPGLDEQATHVVLFGFDGVGQFFEAIYQMRARNLTDSAYVSWTSPSVDLSGGNAPEAILPGSAVVAAIWGDQLVLQTSIPTASFIQEVDAPATTNDPGTGTGYVLVDSASGNWSASDVISLLAAPQVGTTIVVKDSTGSASTKPIVISGNGNDIDGEATETIQVDFASRTLVYNGTEWKVV